MTYRPHCIQSGIYLCEIGSCPNRSCTYCGKSTEYTVQTRHIDEVKSMIIMLEKILHDKEDK